MRERWGDLRSACHAKRWPEVDKILDTWDEATREEARAYAKKHGYKPWSVRAHGWMGELVWRALMLPPEVLDAQRQQDDVFERIMSERER